MAIKGVIAAGHELTVQAAEETLRDGGNAFDAVLAAHFAACVVEPVLASLGGGGFLLAQKPGSHPLVYDFFVHTPRRSDRRRKSIFALYWLTLDRRNRNSTSARALLQHQVP